VEKLFTSGKRFSFLEYRSICWIKMHGMPMRVPANDDESIKKKAAEKSRDLWKMKLE